MSKRERDEQDHATSMFSCLLMVSVHIVYIHILSDIITYKDNMYVFVTY